MNICPNRVAVVRQSGNTKRDAQDQKDQTANSGAAHRRAFARATCQRLAERQAHYGNAKFAKPALDLKDYLGITRRGLWLPRTASALRPHVSRYAFNPAWGASGSRHCRARCGGRLGINRTGPSDGIGVDGVARVVRSVGGGCSEELQGQIGRFFLKFLARLLAILAGAKSNLLSMRAGGDYAS